LAACRKELGLKSTDPMFAFAPGEKDAVHGVFYSLFGNLVKEDYAAV